ncbi:MULTISPECIES: MerR family transcriptional regulator [Halobacillus]|uniref:MerR family transcriptional regulator n=1 Tax=Halobacillus TaxID=45667 RepID=UPI00136EEEC6|nr:MULTISPECIES: MerR family transcriptional regulator [Halobacillus]MCA1022698.1 MerR family transcriptional regulator [Halobacillus litoralis]MYL28595.1 MerR family transcriptional regulator [Halobacillus halophilus]MYL37974.1 MerR family transcriptional regulator [Halobacillus litoralis]
MATTKAKYNIKAVSQMLGIQPGTLRAWERRYKMIRPSRNEAGHRLYTDEHIRILKWLMEKVDKGFTISQAVSLLESNEEAVTHTEQQENRTQLDKIGDQLLDSLLSFNENEAQRHLDHAFSLFTPETVAIDIIGPILVKIGDLWEENKITSAHEHFASQFIRSRIGMMLLSIPSDSMLPKALLVCGPNERHELGLLIFALFLKRKGYDVIYLGQSIAGGDIDIVINEIDPAYMFMSCTLKKNIPITIRLAEALQREFPSLKIGLGGYAYDRLSELDKKRIQPFIVGNSKRAWEQWLQTN